MGKSKAVTNTSGVQVGDPDPWTGDQACCPLPKTGTHRWGDPTDTTKEH